MEAFFFRVEHDMLRSEVFKELGGSAIKVYLVIGLYSNFGSGWAYPSIRTIAKQAGISRQTVLAAVKELADAGLLATSKAVGRSTAYQIIRQGPARPGTRERKNLSRKLTAGGQKILDAPPETGPFSLDVDLSSGQKSLDVLAHFFDSDVRNSGPKQDPLTRTEEHNASIPIPGTPFRLTAEGRLLVSVDLQELLTDQGLPKRLAERLALQRAPEDVAKVLLNALYLQSQGKLQNGPGYIRAGLEDGYDLLPQVASRLESRRRELQEQLRQLDHRQLAKQREQEAEAEKAAMELVLQSLAPDELQRLVDRAVAALPAPLVRRNPTLSNPFVRAKVYELASGEPVS